MLNARCYGFPDLQIADSFERFAARLAIEFPLAVHVLAVAVHAARAAKALVAIGTGMRELSRVLPHVNVQPVLVNKTVKKKYIFPQILQYQMKNNKIKNCRKLKKQNYPKTCINTKLFPKICLNFQQ